MMNFAVIYSVCVFVITPCWVSGQENSSSVTSSLESLVKNLEATVAKLTGKLEIIDDTISNRFSQIENAITDERTTLSQVNDRLASLDSVNEKVVSLDTRVEQETSRIRETLIATNRDVQHLSTQIEEIEQLHHIMHPESAGTEDNHTKRRVPHPAARNSTTERSRSLTDAIVTTVETTLPRILAAELNVFYLNMATKFDSSISMFQTDTIQRLSRVDGHCRDAFRESADNRQDVAHLGHLQRSILRNISDTIRESADSISNKNVGKEEFHNPNVNRLLEQITKNITVSITEGIHMGLKNKLQPLSFSPMGKGGAASDVAKNFDRSSSHPESGLASSTPSELQPRLCADNPAHVILVEVKDLLRTLLHKGEDVRRGLTKKTTEGLELLKQMHQRFGILVRRMNNAPDSRGAMSADIRELEKLIENSYSSILHAQNVFANSCNKLQNEGPSIEFKIEEILSKLLSSIQLGHRFSKVQLDEIKTLIGELRQNFTPDAPLGTLVALPTDEEDEFLKGLNITLGELAMSLESYISAVDNIVKVENDIQIISWKSNKAKDKVDLLLTSVKDLKGFSKKHMERVRDSMDTIENMRRSYSVFKKTLNNSPIKLIHLIHNMDGKNATASIRLPEQCAVTFAEQIDKLRSDEKLQLLRVELSDDTSAMQRDLPTASQPKHINMDASSMKFARHFKVQKKKWTNPSSSNTKHDP